MQLGDVTGYAMSFFQFADRNNDYQVTSREIRRAASQNRQWAQDAATMEFFDWFGNLKGDQTVQLEDFLKAMRMKGGK